MALPATWTTVNVIGTFLNHDGTPASGWITFKSQQVVTVGGVVVVPKTITAVLDGTGSISVAIPATNDPELSVTGWAYTVTEHINDGRPPYLIEVPYSVSTLDLAAAPHATSNPSLPVLTGIYATDIGVSIASQAAVATAQGTADNMRTDLASAAAGMGAALVTDQRTDLTNTKARTLRSRARDQFFLADILPQSELEAIANRASTYDATQELRDALGQSYSGSAYQLILPPGSMFVSDEATFTGTKHIIGHGRIGSTISTSSTAAAILRCTGGGNHRIAHIGFRRHAGTPTAGCAIDMTAITGLSMIEDVYVADQYDGVRLGPTDLGMFRNSVVENSYRHGVVRTTETAAGNIQWRLFDILVQKTEGHGFLDYALAANGNTSTGEILQCYTYACKARSYAAVGTATSKINAIRMANCFLGESGAGEIFLDTYGADHTLDNLYIEISGAAACGRNVATPATNIGLGIEITANNGKGIISNARVYNNAWSGISITAPDWIIDNPDCRNNGRAGLAGNRFGINLVGTTGVYQVQGGRCMNDAAITQQLFGIGYAADNLMLTGVRLDGNVTGPLAGGPALVNSTVLGCYPSTVGNLLPGTLSKGAVAYTNP